MAFKKLVSMNIAVIGNTDVAAMYATGFARAGHDIYMACADVADVKLPDVSVAAGDICVTTISEAAAIADLVIIATHPKDVREAAYWLNDVRRKVIIDVTGNVHVPEDGLVKTACAIKAITGSPHVIKAFNTLGYEALLKPLFNGMVPDLILLSDSKKAKEITKIMAVEMGLSVFYDFGGSEHIPLFNEMTKCWRNLKTKTAQPSELVKKEHH